MTTTVIFWIVGVLAFALSYAIGANDASNALATSYGADAAPLIFLLIGGAIMEMVGAVWCSGAVVTLAEKMIDGLYDNPQATIEKMMLGTTLASFIFIMFASLFGMPISGTHTVIGALIGAGIAGVTVNYINWTKTGWTVASWFISPVLSSIIALLLLALIATVCLGGFVENPKVKLTSACAISAISLAFIGFMVIWLAFDNPDPLLLEITLPVTFAIGWLQTRAAMTLEANKLSGYKMSKLQILKSTLLFWSYSDILEAKISDEAYGSYETALAFSTKASSQELDTDA